MTYEELKAKKHLSWEEASHYIELCEERIAELQNGLRNIYEMLPTKRENDQDIIDEIKRLLKPKENEG